MLTLKQLALAFVLVPILDYFWLGKIMASFYTKELAPVLRFQNDQFTPLLWPAAIVYLCLALGIVFFALPRAGEHIGMGFFWGALLCFVIYGTYDMTNMSTLSFWSLKVAVVDIIWGSVLCGAISSAIIALGLVGES